MKVVIMAGGKGTRIATVNSQVPKPMIPIEGKPILEHQITVLRSQGYTDIVMVVGHMGDVIREYFKDGRAFGVGITYLVEERPLGTAGALYYLKDKVKEDFLLLNGDIIFDVDISRFIKCHKSLGTFATILTHPNSHPYDSGIISADSLGKATGWTHKEDKRLWYKNRVNAGLHMLSPEIFRFFPDVQKRDLDRDILKPLIEMRELGIYDSPEYVKDMGTPERYQEVSRDIREGRVQARNLFRKQKAVFLDRDGTINKYVGFLKDIRDFRLEEGAAEAVRLINQSGYLAVVATNQPVVARGEISLEGLQEIHNKMETLLGREGAYLDRIFCCPHHPDRGFAGERPEYKIPCRCRKPEPGMLLEAAEMLNIDLSASWMVGDGEADIQAGRRAGCSTVRIVHDQETLPMDTDGGETAGSLLKAVQLILSKG